MYDPKATPKHRERSSKKDKYSEYKWIKLQEPDTSSPSTTTTSSTQPPTSTSSTSVALPSIKRSVKEKEDKTQDTLGALPSFKPYVRHMKALGAHEIGVINKQDASITSELGSIKHISVPTPLEQPPSSSLTIVTIASGQPTEPLVNSTPTILFSKTPPLISTSSSEATTPTIAAPTTKAPVSSKHSTAHTAPRAAINISTRTSHTDEEYKTVARAVRQIVQENMVSYCTFYRLLFSRLAYAYDISYLYIYVNYVYTYICVYRSIPRRVHWSTTPPSTSLTCIS